MSSRGEDWKPRELWREKSPSFRARRQHTERFPATSARFYDRLLRNLFLFMFGIDVDRRSEILPGSDPGIVKGDGNGFVGRIRALFNASEAQGRGHLHGHFHLWRLHGPMFLSRHAEVPENLVLLQAHFDRVCTGMLDCVLPLHRTQQINSNLNENYATHEPSDVESIQHMSFCQDPPSVATHTASESPVRGSRAAPADVQPAQPDSVPDCPYPDRPRTASALPSYASSVAPKFQFHKCVRRCRAGKNGQVQCSARFCRNLCSQTTISQWATDNENNDDYESPDAVTTRRLPNIEPMISILPPPGMPVGGQDLRCLCTDIKRPRLQDGFAAEHNSTLAACVNCNNCWMVYTGGQEAKNVRCLSVDCVMPGTTPLLLLRCNVPLIELLDVCVFVFPNL